MTHEVTVTVSDEFWLTLRAAIPDRVRRDRFVARDLPGIKTEFRDNWAGLLRSHSDPYYRTVIGTTHLGDMFSVTARLTSDGDIELRDVSVGEGLLDPEAD
jgi:hypothetical protein